MILFDTYIVLDERSRLYQFYKQIEDSFLGDWVESQTFITEDEAMAALTNQSAIWVPSIGLKLVES